MSGFLLEPTRWKDRIDQANLAERAVGQDIRSLDKPEPLSATQLARIAARILSERSRRRPRRFWLTATAALLFCGAAAASAAHMKILPVWLSGIEGPRPLSAPTTRPSRPARPKSRVPALADIPAANPNDGLPVAAEPSLVEPPAVETESVAPLGKDKVFDFAQPRVTTHKAAPRPLAMNTLLAQPTIPVVPSPPPPSETPPAAALPAEPLNAAVRQSAWAGIPAEDKHTVPVPIAPAGQSISSPSSPSSSSSPPSGWAERPARYLTEAIRALRVEQSPDAALALLDRHAQALNESDFRHEALLLRVEALLKLHRHADALQLLDGTPLVGVAASRTLLLTRGELRAAAGHCVDGLADFDRVLAQTQGHDRRALLGLAKCRKQMGDEAGSRAEMERYRRELSNRQQH